MKTIPKAHSRCAAIGLFAPVLSTVEAKLAAVKDAGELVDVQRADGLRLPRAAHNATGLLSWRTLSTALSSLACLLRAPPIVLHLPGGLW